jgi:hypothetical protein
VKPFTEYTAVDFRALVSSASDLASALLRAAAHGQHEA